MSTIIVFALGYILGGGSALLLLGLILAANRGDRALSGSRQRNREEAGHTWRDAKRGSN